MQYTSAAEDASRIRKELKTIGWTSRQVSVRSNSFSMGSSIDVTIKSAAVPIARVKEIAESAEKISRCEITGEILSGGNRYVSVSYSREALAEFSKWFEPDVQAALAKLDTPASLAKVERTPYMVGRDQHGRPTLWGDSWLATGYDAAEIAREIGVRMAR